MGAAYNELDRSWNRVVRTMYVAKARRVFDHDRWAIMCYDHDGRLVGEDSVGAELSVEEALDAAEELCPDISSL